MELLLSVADEAGMRILKIADVVSHGGRNGYVNNIVVLLCLKKCATLLDIRSYVHGMSLCTMTVK